MFGRCWESFFRVSEQGCVRFSLCSCICFARNTVSDLLPILRGMVAACGYCNPEGKVEGNPTLWRKQLILVISWNEIKDIGASTYEGCDFSDGGTHQLKTKGIRDLSWYFWSVFQLSFIF